MLVKNELINILLENCTTHEEKARLYSLTETAFTLLKLYL